jgi:hypothetical protein
MSIWDAAEAGDLAEVERLVGQDPDLLNAREGYFDRTPLMWASREGHGGGAVAARQGSGYQRAV